MTEEEIKERFNELADAIREIKERFNELDDAIREWGRQLQRQINELYHLVEGEVSDIKNAPR